MRNTGMVRKLDELGRIVIPKEIRKILELEEGTQIEICVNGSKIVLQKHKDTFCPKCLTRCEYTDIYCKNCGINFKELMNKSIRNK